MPENEENSFSLWREALAATSLGWDLAVPIFAGVLLGHALDRWLGSGYVFTLGLLFLGIAIGFYNIFRFVRRIERREQQRRERMERESREQRDE